MNQLKFLVYLKFPCMNKEIERLSLAMEKSLFLFFLTKKCLSASLLTNTHDDQSLKIK